MYVKEKIMKSKIDFNKMYKKNKLKLKRKKKCYA